MIEICELTNLIHKRLGFLFLPPRYTEFRIFVIIICFPCSLCPSQHQSCSRCWIRLILAMSTKLQSFLDMKHKIIFICWMTAYIHGNLTKGDKWNFILSPPFNVYIVYFYSPASIFLWTSILCIVVWCQKVSHAFSERCAFILGHIMRNHGGHFSEEGGCLFD